MSANAELTGRTELADLYSALAGAAELVGAACLREKAWPVLAAYDAAKQDVIAFRVTTNARNESELDCRFSLPDGVDAYSVALAAGLTPATDHPVGSLLAEVRGRFPVDSSAVDFEVGDGFRKAWVFFPQGSFPSVSELAGIASMPPSLAGNADILARHGLVERVDVFGIDYHDKTVNLYFPERLEPDIIRSLHREVGLPEPSVQMLEFCENAFGLYTTLSWDSSTVERISFGVRAQDPLALPIPVGARIEQFAKRLAYGADYPKQVYAALTSAGEEYYKLQLYYRWQPHGHRAGRDYRGGRELPQSQPSGQ